MEELALQSPVITPVPWTRPPAQLYTLYGSAEGMLSQKTWDSKIMRGCKCDSSWEVGYEQFQRQLSEYFGPDCSQRTVSISVTPLPDPHCVGVGRCPSGDDPMTLVNEEDCEGKSQLPGSKLKHSIV